MIHGTRVAAVESWRGASCQQHNLSCTQFLRPRLQINWDPLTLWNEKPYYTGRWKLGCFFFLTQSSAAIFIWYSLDKTDFHNQKNITKEKKNFTEVNVVLSKYQLFFWVKLLFLSISIYSSLKSSFRKGTSSSTWHYILSASLHWHSLLISFGHGLSKLKSFQMVWQYIPFSELHKLLSHTHAKIKLLLLYWSKKDL